jgi:hypothetical protein
MNWQAVYEIDRSGTGSQFIPFIAMGLVVLALALILHLRARRRRQRSSVARFLVIGGVLIGVLGYGVNTWDQVRLAKQLTAGEARVVAGPVVAHQIWREDVTNPKKDTTRRYRRWETITVDGIQFIWSPGAQEAAFTNAQTPPVDFHDGLYVRIAYVEDVPDQAHQRRILRLETADVGDGRVLPGAPFPSVAPVVVPAGR